MTKPVNDDLSAIVSALMGHADDPPPRRPSPPPAVAPPSPPRAATPTAAPPSTHRALHSDDELLPGPWVCSVCTFRNETWRALCEACQSLRDDALVTAALPPPDDALSHRTATSTAARRSDTSPGEVARAAAAAADARRFDAEQAAARARREAQESRELEEALVRSTADLQQAKRQHDYDVTQARRQSLDEEARRQAARAADARAVEVPHRPAPAMPSVFAPPTAPPHSRPSSSHSTSRAEASNTGVRGGPIGPALPQPGVAVPAPLSVSAAMAEADAAARAAAMLEEARVARLRADAALEAYKLELAQSEGARVQRERGSTAPPMAEVASERRAVSSTSTPVTLPSPGKAAGAAVVLVPPSTATATTASAAAVATAGTPRRVSSPELPASSNQRSHRLDGAAGDTWQCDHCTFAGNPAGLSECTVCFLPREDDAASSGSGSGGDAFPEDVGGGDEHYDDHLAWQCSNCGDSNLSRHTLCRTCFKGVQPRPGSGALASPSREQAAIGDSGNYPIDSAVGATVAAAAAAERRPVTATAVAAVTMQPTATASAATSTARSAASLSSSSGTSATTTGPTVTRAATTPTTPPTAAAAAAAIPPPASATDAPAVTTATADRAGPAPATADAVVPLTDPAVEWAARKLVEFPSGMTAHMLTTWYRKELPHLAGTTPDWPRCLLPPRFTAVTTNGHVYHRLAVARRSPVKARVGAE